MAASGDFRWPLKSNQIRKGVLNNTYGDKVRKNADGTDKAHQGWDLYAAKGTLCYAIGKGKVAVVTNDHVDWGNIVVIEFEDVKINNTKIYAAYAHLDSMKVNKGDEVKIGQEIGETGVTGNASGMTGDDQHLHFEIRTVAQPGTGLAGRLDPKDLYGEPPLAAPTLDLKAV